MILGLLLFKGKTLFLYLCPHGVVAGGILFY